MTPRRPPLVCECIARLRTRRDPRPPKRGSYYRAPVRMCRGQAVVCVTVATKIPRIRMCRSCFRRELLEHEHELLSFEVLRPDAIGAAYGFSGIAEAARIVARGWREAHPGAVEATSAPEKISGESPSPSRRRAGAR